MPVRRVIMNVLQWSIRSLYIIILVILSCLLYPVSSFANEHATMDDAIYSEVHEVYALKWAARNLQANKKFYLKMLEKVDGATGLAWIKILGENIPAQPVAAMEILTLSKVTVESVCPPFFPEDTPDHVIDEWNKSAIEVLRFFTMTDPENEKTRQQCLKSIIQANDEWIQKKAP